MKKHRAKPATLDDVLRAFGIPKKDFERTKANVIAMVKRQRR